MKLTFQTKAYLGLAATMASAVVLTTLVGTGDNAVAGIKNTKHNLGSSQTNTTFNRTSGTDEICVFCHTPHAANLSVTAPLWNKNLPSTTYTTYEATSTMSAIRLSAGSVSLGCLSCHDGSQAMDNIINAPGSGGFSSDGGGVNGLGWTWTAGNASSAGVDTNGIMTSNTVAMLNDGSNSLKNDHPIGIQYCGGGISTTSGTCTDTDFNSPKTSTFNNLQVWWVDTGTANSTREKTDMILYTRDFGSGGTGPSVECASCHDPHSENTTFLRVSNSASGVCLACHTK